MPNTPAVSYTHLDVYKRQLLDRYIEEQAKFKKGQVVYMEYTYQYHNQTKLGVCAVSYTHLVSRRGGSLNWT